MENVGESSSPDDDSGPEPAFGDETTYNYLFAILQGEIEEGDFERALARRK